MDKIDTKLMIHVGCELLIVGGIAFYLNGKIKTLSDRVSALEQQNAQLKQMFDAHEDIIRQALGKGSRPPQQRAPQANSHSNKKPTKSAPEPKTQQIDEVNQDELDKELQDEYGELMPPTDD